MNQRMKSQLEFIPRILGSFKTTTATSKGSPSNKFGFPQQIKVISKSNAIDIDTGFPHKFLSLDEQMRIDNLCFGTPLDGLVIPLYNFLYRICLIPYLFKFDVKSQSYVCYKGSGACFRKLFSQLFVLLALVDIMGFGDMAERTMEKESTNGNFLHILFRIKDSIYYAYVLAISYCFVSKGNEVAMILNLILDVTKSIQADGGIFPDRKKIKSFGLFLIMIVTIKGMHFLYSVLETNITSNSGSEKGFCIFFGEILNCLFTRLVNLYENFTSGEKNTSPLDEPYNYAERIPKGFIVLIGVMYIMFNFLVSLYWLWGYLMLIMWSLVFWKIFAVFFALVCGSEFKSNAAEFADEVLKRIRNFNDITNIICKFNDAYGLLVLLSVISGISHFSGEIMRFTKHSRNFHQTFAVVTMLIIFVCQMGLSAQVNSTAYNIVEMIKSRYHATSGYFERERGNCEAHNEVTQGIALILHDIETSHIGLKGLGFFTITYSFLGTVASVISTYTVVIIQFDNTVITKEIKH